MPTAASTHLKFTNQVAEVRSLTGLRGLAALYVVVFHFYQPLLMTSRFRTFLAHGYLAVDLFFALSGFVIALNYGSMFAQGATLAKFKLFFSRRFARIYPIYLFTLLLSVLVFVVHKDPIPATVFWTNVFLVQNWGFWPSLNTAAWSLSTEWFAYLLFPFLVPVLLFRSWRAAASVLAVCVTGLLVLAFTFLGTARLGDVSHLGGTLDLLRCVFEFTLGMVAYRAVSSRFGQMLKNSGWSTTWLSGAILVLLCFPSTDLAVIFLSPMLLLSLDGAPDRITRFLGWYPVELLGLLSFSVYLLHMPIYRSILWPLDTYFKHAGYSHAHTYATSLCMVLLFPASALTYYGIEVPSRRVLRRLLERKPRAIPSSADTGLAVGGKS